MNSQHCDRMPGGHRTTTPHLKRRFCITLLLCSIVLFSSYYLLSHSTYYKGFGVSLSPYLNNFSFPLHFVEESNSNTVDELARTLEEKIETAKLSVKETTLTPACETNETLANSCEGTCLRTEISDRPRDRISQLLNTKELQLTPDTSATLREMKGKVDGSYDVIFLTAASSNHFLESQAMLKNLHVKIFPDLKNFTLIYYNLGFTQEERQLLKEYCKCTVIDFPFEKFPKFVENLRCYSWKPIMIKAHLSQGNVLVWMDASVRFESFEQFQKLIKTTKDRGFQMAGPAEQSPFRTARSMYHFFGDEPCAYLQMGQLHATNGYFKNEFFVERAILEPWVACALNRSCMCPVKVRQKASLNVQMSRLWRDEGEPVIYGLVHRFDQSAISLIVHKLFHKYYFWLLFRRTDYSVEFARRNEMKYFPTHGNQTNTTVNYVEM